MNPDAGKEEQTAEPRTERGRQAMEGLRSIWLATGQMQEEFVELECGPENRSCSAALGSLGFDGLADDTVEPTTNTTEAIARLRSAWKATLAREGKLYDPEGSPGEPVERGEAEGRR